MTNLTWQQIQDITEQVPHALLPWLTCQTSLTEKLQQLTGQAVSVEVLCEDQCLLQQDAKLLQQPAKAEGVCREIYLHSAGLRWIGARTLIPKSLWHQQALAGLGNRPIGTLLFEQPVNSQRQIECCYLEAKHHHFDLLNKHELGLWGRRSVFFIEQSPILIYEFFSERLYA